MLIEKRLEELGITLPNPPQPVANYVRAQRSGDLLFISGTGPSRDGKTTYVGAIGRELTAEQGYEIARQVAINLITTLKQTLGDLDKVEQIVKLLAFVRSADDFGGQPAVVNGASDLLVEVFGEKGRHARSAIGTNALPQGIPVEIEAIVRVKP